MKEHFVMLMAMLASVSRYAHNFANWACSANSSSIVPIGRCVALLCLVWFQTVNLQAAPPAIEWVWPPVGQSGTDFQVKIVGSGLADCRGMMFYSPDIKCPRIEVLSEYEMRATVSVAKECRIGNEPFRVFGSQGFSEMRTLRISPYPVISLESKDSAEPLAEDSGKPQSSDVSPLSVPSVTLPAHDVTLCGTLRAGAVDRFSVQLKAGQRFTAEAEAVRLGKELLDTVLSIVGPDGQVLVTADDNALLRQDPVATILAPVSGLYTVEIHESNYSGSENSFYALHVGGFEPPCVAYPAGGQPGSALNIRFITATSDVSRKVKLPTDEALLGRFQLFNAEDQQPTASAVPFRLSELPNVMEVETTGTSNDQPSDSVAGGAPPVALNGILASAKDVDSFGIEVSDQRPLRIEVFSQRIGAPLDSFLTVVNSSAQIVASNDDWGDHDSRIDFVPPAPGKYFVCIKDKLAAGGPNYVYRIEVSHLKPELVAFLPRPQRTSQQSQTISVPQDNRVLIRIGAQRQSITGEVRTGFLDLPQGVQAPEVVIPSDRFWMPALLEASSEATPASATYSSVFAKGQYEGQEVVGQFEQVVDLVAESADQLFTSASVSRLPVVVTSPLPFKIELTPPTAVGYQWFAGSANQSTARNRF
ncbi:MAG: PPC domain-containing protein [Pirellulaceae bacterium]|nr:PPC domain-containing protein [Pirellulaceae bacterium]